MSIKLTELAAYLLNTNGQHIAGDLDSFEFDYTKLYYALKPDMDNFADYFPITKKFNISQLTGTNTVYDFTTHPENIGYNIDDIEAPIYGNPPESILKCTPVGGTQVMTNWAQWNSTRQVPGTLGFIPTPRLVKREYRKPKLYVSETGKFDVTASYRPYHKISQTGQTITEVEILELEESRLFYDLMSARFLLIVGRTRRAFTHQNFPIITDAADLVREGNELFENTWKAIYDRNPWYKAYKH